MKAILIISLSIFYSFSFSQDRDSLIDGFSENLKAYKNTIDGTFLLKKNNKVKFKNLKFILPIWGYFQVLDENNLKFYIDNKGRKQKKTKINLGLCGTVPHYTCEIKIDNDKFIITKDETFYDYGNKEPFEVIDSIKKEGIDKIYFTNKLQKINYNENDFVFNFTKTFPYAVIIEKGTKKGILYNGQLSFYDEIIETKNWITKVKIDNKVGFYNLTEIKYSDLSDFIFGLARFTLEDGKKGYVDINGKEYFD
ncbi:hypothetical protein EG359_20585 [Chryseobacterium joostei]|uniref:WG repeat-containing protein n=1 Tax=Chryseobacterium joostei TaxID=112234 RepID=A0A1N7IBR1_9FLAO|nr:hypothetical protein [Chryseobacterium joostei]AZB01841.1 hypothetical protein EG359_20585 [Chryseobacterium joostei]SIS34519.1 hypothetical protein SAMN05421768_10417 [Chryseobacterium joostei]